MPRFIPPCACKFRIKRSFFLVASILAIGLPARPTLGGSILNWDANAANSGHSDGPGPWLAADQWLNGTSNTSWTSGDAATFGHGGSGGAVALGSPTAAASLTFNAFSGTYTLGSPAQMLTIDQGIHITASAGAVTFASPITLGGNQTWSNHSTSTLLTGKATELINNNGYQLTIDGPGDTTFGVINQADPSLTGAGTLVKNGAGRLQVGGVNPGFTGEVAINGGILLAHNHTGALGSGNVALNGGVLSFYWSINYTRSLGSGSGQVRVLGGASGFAGSGTSGPTINLGSTIVWGAAGDGSATGYFNPAKLVLGDAVTDAAASTTFSSAIDLNGSTRTIQVPVGKNSSGNKSTLSGTIRNSVGTAGLIKEGGGTLVLSVANSHNGGNTLQEGTLQLGHVDALGAKTATLTIHGGLLNLNNINGVVVGNLTGNGGMIANNGANNRTLTIGSGDGSGGHYQGTITNTTAAHAGTLALTKTGSGSVILSGDHSYTGVTTIDGGTLQMGAGGTTGSLASQAVINNATLVYDRSNDFSVGYAISGSGQLIKQGAGTMTCTTPAAYSGDTTISAGMLALKHPNAGNDAAAMTIAPAGASLHLDFSGTDTVRDLFIGATRMPTGIYKAVGNPAPGIEIVQITGTGTLTVTGDVNPPTWLGMQDNKNSRSVAANTPVSYTVTFSESLDMGSVSAEDFANAGTAPVTIDSISETAPGVLTVIVTATDRGTLQLSIPAGASLTDPAGNVLETTAEILDDVTLAIYVSDYGPPELIGISPIAANVGSTITLSAPPGVKPGDLLVANIVNYASGDYGAVFNTVTDWRSMITGRFTGQNNTRLGVYYRVVTESDSGTYNLGLGYEAPFAAAGVVMAFSHVDTTYGPTDVSASSIYSDAAATMTAGPVSQITTASPNTMLLMLGMAMGSEPVEWSDWSTSSIGPLAELYDVATSGGIRSISLGAASAIMPLPGATGTGSASLSSSMNNGALLLALRPSHNQALVSALNALNAHITGVALLSDTQIATHKTTIFNNRKSIGTSPSALAAAMNLVRTYDQVLGPLWIARPMPNRASLINDIHYTVFTVMQYILDYGYTSANLANHSELLDSFSFGSSANFPGACAPPADPDEIHTVLINANYPDTWGRPVFEESSTTCAPKPTGTYLAPGSIAEVTVPPSLVDRGYRIRVGAHWRDFVDKTSIKRLDRCSIVYPINSTTTRVGNPLGGGIYIEVPPYISDVGVVNVEIRNAVRSPYFSAKPFHRTTLDEWRNTERHHPAPWADFQSEKVMMQVPTSWIYALDDPVKLMADWDRAADVCNDLMGFPLNRGRETIYNQVDLLLREVAYTPGYPAVNNTYSPGTNYGGYANSYLVRGPQFAPDFEFHELGHAYKFSKFPGETESDVNLLHVPVMQLGFGDSIDQAFRKSRSGPAYATLDTTAVAWMMCDNFLNGLAMEEAEKQYALKGHAKFVEIARLFGWDRLSNYFRSFNEDYEANNKVIIPTNVDSLLMRLSSRVGIDIRPLFHFWGVPPVNPATLGDAIQAAGLPSSAVIYDTLTRYKSLVPSDNAAFRSFANGWWGRQPLDTGYSEERNHAARWHNYNEASASATANRAQQIIDLYFPNGRPSEYGDWRSQWPSANLLDPQADLDNDGMINAQERIWGLDPTNPRSRNPILFNRGVTAGSFSYTRRNPALTGLNYSVWTSTDLGAWTEDAGAQQIPSATDADGVQTVETMLSPALLDHPSLYIRLKTDE